MKILHISYSVGEASANTRLHYALLEKGIDSKILTLEGDTTLKEVYKIESNSFKGKLVQKWRWFCQVIFNKIFIRDNMPYHMGIWGKHIEKEQLVREADIIHLHWICDFVSPKTISKIISFGKPVVWTCHDSWPFTGGCNVKYDCQGYKNRCENCIIMKNRGGNLITRYVWKNKEKFLKVSPIIFIVPSNWMFQNVTMSSLFFKNKCYVIPNTLDMRIYEGISDAEIKNRLNYEKDSSKINILFGATSIEISYKGFRYLLEMLDLLWTQHREIADRVVLHVLGKGISNESILDKYQCKFWGYVRDERSKACIYSMVDFLVYPSLEDSFSNVVMESLLGATPAVIFNTGGIPDMVEHKKNGYIATYKDSLDLLNGLLWCISNNKNNILGIYGRDKIRRMCSFDVIAEEHIKVYEECMQAQKGR